MVLARGKEFVELRRRIRPTIVDWLPLWLMNPEVCYS